MFLMKLYRLFIFTVLVISSAAYGSDQELLHLSDVNKIMKQIFDQHVDQKEMTNSVLKKALTVYIDQFDPDRIYLLESEVRLYQNVSDKSADDYMEQYKHERFTEFIDLNNLIQRAIVRAQKARLLLLNQNPQELLEKSSVYNVDGKEQWDDPDLKRPFAVNESDLHERQKQALLKFIAQERLRYGNNYIASHAKQAIQFFERECRYHENQYLYLTDNGQAMNASEKENAMTMHILKALASALDAHTTVLSSAEASDMRIRLEKEVKGVGIEVYTKEGKIFVKSLWAGGPAAISGLVKVNDEIVQVDNNVVKGKSPEEVISLMRGKSGTKIVLLLKRVEANGQEQTLTVPLICDDIAVDEDRAISSFVHFDKDIIGKITLDSFYQNEKNITSENDVRDAINKLKKEGNLRGLILDLRENSGGFLSQAVKVVGLFITNGVVVVSKYFNGEEHFYRDMDGKVSYSGPFVVLTSKATASAAEIVAQALQDYGVAIIVGDEHTYGKGSIQSQTVTENQGSTYFKVTVGKYYTVSGKTPQIQGVKADIIVPSQFAHETMGEEYLDYPLKQDTIESSYDDKLADISPDLKSWYLHYYLPQLEHKKVFWDKFIPILKQKSADRIAHNPRYQRFLKSNPTKEQGSDIEDLQMTEAIKIIEDMIDIETKARLKNGS